MRRDPSLIPLSHQHHNALALCVLTDRSLAGDTSQANIDKCAAKVIDRFDLEMRNHFELEETFLFPLCPDAAVELIREHRQMESMVEQMRTGPTIVLLQAFTTLLRTHVRKEESGLFEEAQRELPRETLDQIGAVFEQRAVRVCL